jgi:hypothetical protein
MYVCSIGKTQIFCEEMLAFSVPFVTERFVKNYL